MSKRAYLALPVLGGICGGFRLGWAVSLIVLAIALLALLTLDYAERKHKPVEKPE